MPHRRLSRIAAIGLLFASCRGDVPSAPEPEPDSGAASGSIAPAGSGRYVPGRVLVAFAPGAAEHAIARSQGGSLGRLLRGGARIVHVSPGREIAVARALARSPRVEFAEPDWLRTLDDPTCAGCGIPGDPFFGFKWDLDNDGTIEDSGGNLVASTGAVDADVDWREAFGRLGGGFGGVARVAILDTGVRTTHEDLAGKIVAQYDFYDDDPDATDDQGHGTHVAGIAAARGDNGIGLSGIGYGAGIGIMAAKVCTPTFFGLNAECPSSAIVEAIHWAVDNDGDVINLSLGGPEGSELEREALAYARANDVLAVCAAGNAAEARVLFPGAFDECVAIAATDWSDGQASYSNWGPEVELAAPGGDNEDGSGYSQIASTCFEGDASYCLKAGTSMASPQVAGLAALLYALGLTTDDEVLARMRDTVDDLGDPGRDERFGHGRINVDRAIDGLSGVGPPNEAPSADFAHTCDGPSCAFSDASGDVDGTVVAWSWTFGDGATSTERNPVHAYACGGVYDVTLRVTDDRGATNSVTRPVTVSAGAGSTDAPATIPDLILWLKADALALADGEPVARWTDSAGSCSEAVQPTASKRPVYRTGQANGRPAVVFDAVDDGMATSVDPGSEVTVVTVYASRAGDSGRLLSGGSRFFMGPYVGRYRNYTGGFATGPRVEAGRWVVHALRQGTAEDELFIDGERVAATDKRADPQTLALGREGVYSDELDGGVAELLVYDRALDDAELASVHDWLIGRYLPPPGTNAPPVASFTESCDALGCDLTDASADGDGAVIAWSWSFGDGETSTERHPSHEYAAAGAYAVRLEVTDDGGATDAVERTIEVTAAPAGGPFEDPSSLPGLVLWLKADALTGFADGDPVGAWPDASGGGHDAVQTSGSRRPTYVAETVTGLPALRFDATDDGMATTVDPSTEVTVTAVYASRAGASGHLLNGGFRFFLGPYVGRYRNYTGGFATGPPVESGRWVVHTLRQSAAVDELFIDGTLESETSSTADPRPILLADEGTYGQPLDGHLAEVVVYDRTLSDAERADVEAWLKARYAIP